MLQRLSTSSHGRSQGNHHRGGSLSPGVGQGELAGEIIRDPPAEPEKIAAICGRIGEQARSVGGEGILRFPRLEGPKRALES